MKSKYSIETVRDQEGKFWEASEILSKPSNEINRIRTECFEARQQGNLPPFVCGFCFKPVWLPATITREHHFKHFSYQGIEKCIYYSGEQVSIEYLNARKYNGAKEGRKHIEFKELILRCLNLNQSISDLQSEAVISLPKFENKDFRREWRKPDINGKFNNIHFALELQFSTTWLKEIVGRTLFYRKLGYFLIWVFDKFNPVYADREVAYSDVFCNNNENAFVFDEECYRLSTERNDLVLKCYYSQYVRNGFSISSEIILQVITFSDLTFNPNQKMVYYFDSLGDKRRLEIEINREENQLAEESKRQLEEYQRAEWNKEIDIQINGIQSSLENQENKLARIKEEKEKAKAALETIRNKKLDFPKAASKVLYALQNNESIPNQISGLINETKIKRFSEQIKYVQSQIENGKKSRAYLEKVLASLKVESRKKLQGVDFVVIPREKLIFDEFYQSIYSVRRIEIETTVVKPDPKKISYLQISPTAIKNNELVFLMTKVGFEQNRKELLTRIESININLNLDEILNDIENEMIRTVESELNKSETNLERLLNSFKENKEALLSLNEELVCLLDRKRLYNSEVIF